MEHGFSYCGHSQLQRPLGFGFSDENKGGCWCWKGIIQMQNGLGMEVELMPLIIVNMLQHVSE
jgi:hypothetical protein